MEGIEEVSLDNKTNYGEATSDRFRLKMVDLALH